MNKTLKVVLLIFGILSILYAIYGIIKGVGIVQASGGIIIGVCLIAAIKLYDNKKL